MYPSQSATRFKTLVSLRLGVSAVKSNAWTRLANLQRNLELVVAFFRKRVERWGRMLFASRQDAGRKLARYLRALAVEVDLVAGLPRGGVVVAAEVADELKLPLDVMVVRKIGHPWHREYAVGAVAEDNVLLLDRELIAVSAFTTAELDQVIAEEQQQLLAYCETFHHGRPNPFANKRVLLVDDGLATGATAEAAVRAVRKNQAQQVMLAVPVSSDDGCARLEKVADRVLALVTDSQFKAVGQYYRQFDQTTDTEVLALLHRFHADYRGRPEQTDGRLRAG